MASRRHPAGTTSAIKPATGTSNTSMQLQLPMWPEQTRGFPNSMARSALFTVANVHGGEREILVKQTIATLNGIAITYSGAELRQDDEDVFLQLLHLARHQPLGEPVGFTAYSLLGTLSWSQGSLGYRRLVDCIERLKFSSLAITVEGVDGARENFTGSLIRSFRWKEESSGASMREWQILFEPEIVGLFAPTAYSRLDWETRLKLPPMAKWLFSFYHTHQEPYPYKVDTLRMLMGSKIKELRMFRTKLRQALDKLVECGFLCSAQIDSRADMVIIQRRQEAQRTNLLSADNDA